MEIKLFPIVLPDGETPKKELYYRSKSTELSSGEALTTDTYFGSFSCARYFKYTYADGMLLTVTVSGEGVAELCFNDGSITKTVVSAEFNNAVPTEIVLKCVKDKNFSNGILYLRLTTDSHCSLLGGHYSVVTNQTNDIHLGIISCTFRREEYVKNNICRMVEFLQENPADIDIYCIDNGNTLSASDICIADNVKLFPNANFGGSGGFTRGMMEMLRSDKRYTHAWIMDDDIEFEPSTLMRILSFLSVLKPEYKNAHLCAGMMTFEEPTIQYEASARYDGMTFRSNNAGFDLTKISSLIENEQDTPADYAGWWSFVMPFDDIRRDNLPLPFFIKLDDIEFGMRNSGKFIVLNGFGVWHQSFVSKVSAHLEYYTTRNALIIASLYPEKRRVTSVVLSRLIKAISFNEPKFMLAALRGVTDFTKGPEFLMNVSANKLNDEITSEYKFVAAAPENRKKMLINAAKNVFKPNSFKSLSLYFKAKKQLRSFDKTAQLYRDDFKNMTSFDFWEGYMS